MRTLGYVSDRDRRSRVILPRRFSGFSENSRFQPFRKYTISGVLRVKTVYSCTNALADPMCEMMGVSKPTLYKYIEAARGNDLNLALPMGYEPKGCRSWRPGTTALDLGAACHRAMRRSGSSRPIADIVPIIWPPNEFLQTVYFRGSIY